MTNTERQRKFRERNPGYYARIQATKRAASKRATDLMIAEMQRAHAAACAAAAADAEARIHLGDDAVAADDTTPLSIDPTPFMRLAA